jgi:sugar/nucleoside kinase (ribokinase family)
MQAADFEVLGIGNAIVDVIAHTDDAFLVAQNMAKGGMSLVSEERAEQIYNAIGPTIQTSGGSAGNTVAGLASLGGRTAYIGKVKRDALGEVFTHDIRSLGVHFDTHQAEDGPSTARCIVLVSDDAQRTMNTYLGACLNLTVNDVDASLVERAAITYLEGYLFDPPQAKLAFRKAAKIARANGRKVALSLSDQFCVDRYRNDFTTLIGDHIDILFANESELLALYETDRLGLAIERVSVDADIAAITLGENGSLIVSGNSRYNIPAIKNGKIVDTTGAGDLYASGFLFGLAKGWRLEQCGDLGSRCAGEVISHFGGRPETDLAALVGQ